MSSAAHKTRTLWLSGVLHAFTHLYHVVLLPLYVLILQDPKLGLTSIEQSTSLMTILMLAYYIPSYFMGVLADRMSKKRLLAIGLGINGLGIAALAFANNYLMAAACVTIAGIGGSFYHPAATALVARLYPEATGKALGLVGIGASAGFFLGPLYSGWRAEMAGWRAPVLELGIAGVVTAFLFYWFAEEETAAEPVPAHAPQPSHVMFPTPALWLFFLAAAFAFSFRDFSGSAIGSLGSLFLQKVYLLDTERTGGILSCIFLASAISNPLFGRLSDRNQGTWVSIALLTAAVVAFIFPHVPVQGAAPMLALYGFFFMASFPMVEAALMNSVPHHVRGRVFGLFITIGGFFGNLAHWLMGAWVKHLGVDAARVESYYPIYTTLAVMIALSLLGLPFLRALRVREAKAGDLAPGLAPGKTGRIIEPPLPG